MSETPASPAASPTEPERARAVRDRAVGLGVIAVSFIVAMALSYSAKQRSLPRLAPPPGPASAEGIVGFPTAVAPLEALALAKKHTVRDQFVGLALTGVTSEGTIDVSNGGRARYVFRSLPGEGPEPEREYGTLALRKYCGFQVIVLNEAGMGAEPDVSNADCRRAIDPLPEPSCSLAQVWEVAKRKGADPSQAATIEYYRAGAGPAWWFESGAVSVALGADCNTELGAEEARGISLQRVPG
jgi:hypothetical protein